MHRLTFPAPYLRPSTARALLDAAAGHATVRSERSVIAEPYLLELEHFHDCVSREHACRTSAEHARADLALLRDAFQLAASNEERHG